MQRETTTDQDDTISSHEQHIHVPLHRLSHPMHQYASIFSLRDARLGAHPHDALVRSFRHLDDIDGLLHLGQYHVHMPIVRLSSTTSREQRKGEAREERTESIGSARLLSSSQRIRGGSVRTHVEDTSELPVTSQLDEDALGEGDADEIEGFYDLHGWNGVDGTGEAGCSVGVLFRMW